MISFITKRCDIKGCTNENVKEKVVSVVFEHDQEDGRRKVEPYLSTKSIDICDKCWKKMLEERKLIYAYGCMGYNTYEL